MTLAAGTTSPPSWCRSRSRRHDLRGPTEETPLMSQPAFTVDVDHNQYLHDGARDVSAVATVTSDGTPGVAAVAGSGSAEIIIIDCSGSMDVPHSTITQARTATAAAVDVVRDGAWFAVIACTRFAKPVYSNNGAMPLGRPPT